MLVKEAWSQDRGAACEKAGLELATVQTEETACPHTLSSSLSTVEVSHQGMNSCSTLGGRLPVYVSFRVNPLHTMGMINPLSAGEITNPLHTERMFNPYMS